MTAVKDGDIAHQNVSAELKCNGLVALVDGTGAYVFVAPGQPAAVYHALARNRHIHEVFTPNQTVVKIRMSAVLICLALERLGRVVGFHVLRRAKDNRAGVDQQIDVAHHVNTAA